MTDETRRQKFTAQQEKGLEGKERFIIRGVHPGPPPSLEAWTRLVGELLLASQVERDPKLPPGLSSILRASLAINKYITSAEVSKNFPLGIEFSRLNMAIADIAQSRRSTLFEPVNPPSHNPGKPFADAILMGVAARSLDELMEAGIPKTSAGQRVCAVLRRRTPPLERPPSTIIGWRDRLREGPGRVPADALRTYSMAAPENIASQNAERRAEWFLSLLELCPSPESE